MKRQAEELRWKLKTEGFDKQFGIALKTGWERKRAMASTITNSVIDGYYDKAIEAGALGGRLLEAGGGGFLLFYVEPQYQEAVRQALYELKEVDFHINKYGSRVVYFG